LLTLLALATLLAGLLSALLLLATLTTLLPGLLIALLLLVLVVLVLVAVLVHLAFPLHFRERCQKGSVRHLALTLKQRRTGTLRSRSVSTWNRQAGVARKRCDCRARVALLA
jgi:hypothetical protein